MIPQPGPWILLQVRLAVTQLLIPLLQRVDAELTRRGALLRDAGVQEISSYREKTGRTLPRCLLLIDETESYSTAVHPSPPEFQSWTEHLSAVAH